MTQTQIQFLGHASFKVISPEGKVILVDPWLINNPFIPDEFRNQLNVDLVLITHGHEDHMDPNIIELIKGWNCKLIVNPIVRWYLLEHGVDGELFEPMNLGGTISVLGIKISMVQAHHIAHIPESETKARFQHPTVGFVLQFSDTNSVYFAGDTSVFGDMKLIGDIYNPKIAVLPIGDRFTMGPLEATYALKLLNTKHLIPFHFGTYSMLTGTVEELRECTNEIEKLSIHSLKAGETLDCSTL
ncbi:metal-dependent hydrolase [Solitalea sp. MAHUQ-68]|uniref:Metal-dependent hydrolase n=1 Tax=Solitalea agri TaxID=2953739 RepID=A0A9X2F072_9SPHI|nr:metal-dependent hydrolase [Solitalea agri]MCO4291816.1 metal-dependent hydrolase [Solitalea agri]